VVHPPVAAGMCTSCHDPHSSRADKMLTPDMPELCFKCHGSKEFSRRSKHGPVAIGMCTACHEPHQANQEKLLKAKTPDLCFNCHRKSQFTKKDIHPPVAAGECLKCHVPHSSPYRNILVADGNEVCKKCHEQPFKGAHAIFGVKQEGHKISGKRDPRRPGRRFGCASCHNPHSSDSVRLFRYPAQAPYELCVNCHKK